MDNKNQIIELVVYKVKGNPADSKQIIIEQTNKGLGKLDGYLYRQVYQSIDDPSILFDYVAWDNLENAVNAAKNMNKILELDDFVKLIEKTEIFEHFSFANHYDLTNKQTETVELVIYQLKEDKNHEIGSFFQTYNDVIANVEGYNNRVLLQSAKNENLWAERVFWDNLELAKQNEQKMQQNPTLGAAFSIVEKVILIKHFQLFA